MSRKSTTLPDYSQAVPSSAPLTPAEKEFARVLGEVLAVAWAAEPSAAAGTAADCVVKSAEKIEIFSARP